MVITLRELKLAKPLYKKRRGVKILLF